MSLETIIMKHLNDITYTPSPKPATGSFLNNLFLNTSKGLTENGAVTFTRSSSPLLDFYAQAGAMRGSPNEALELFKKAFSENNLYALRVLFYLRDVRGGQGERDLFRTCLEWLGADHKTTFNSIVKFIPEYGRFDDLLFDNDACFELIKKQMEIDEGSTNPSLLAKWLPTMNASSPKTRAKARFVAKKLGMHEVTYRKTVRLLRKKIETVEELMSAQKWGSVDYSHVPSQASRIYRNAFRKHDETRYGAFVEKATMGEVKINAGTLYPYQIYNSVMEDYSPTLEALWNQLPDYTSGKNALVIADVSGSMTGDPMSVSVSLALYFAERSKGQFKDHFITFSANPVLQRIQGNTLLEKMASIQRSQWDMNTNLQAVFDLILSTAVGSSAKPEELPSTIYIISDMEFDQACSYRTSFELIKTKYVSAGYTMPSMVFWNVNARSGKNLPTPADEQGVALVSGFSPVIFKMAVENKTPEQVMLDTINSERYACITL